MPPPDLQSPTLVASPSRTRTLHSPLAYAPPRAQSQSQSQPQSQSQSQAQTMGPGGHAAESSPVRHSAGEHAAHRKAAQDASAVSTPPPRPSFTPGPTSSPNLAKRLAMSPTVTASPAVTGSPVAPSEFSSPGSEVDVVTVSQSEERGPDALVGRGVDKAGSKGGAPAAYRGEEVAIREGEGEGSPTEKEEESSGSELSGDSEAAAATDTAPGQAVTKQAAAGHADGAPASGASGTATAGMTAGLAGNTLPVRGPKTTPVMGPMAGPGQATTVTPRGYITVTSRPSTVTPGARAGGASPGTPTLVLPPFFSGLPYSTPSGAPMAGHQRRFLDLQRRLQALEEEEYKDLTLALEGMKGQGRSAKASSAEKRNLEMLLQEGREMQRAQGIGILAKRRKVFGTPSPGLFPSASPGAPPVPYLHAKPGPPPLQYPSATPGAAPVLRGGVPAAHQGGVGPAATAATGAGQLGAPGVPLRQPFPGAGAGVQQPARGVPLLGVPLGVAAHAGMQEKGAGAAGGGATQGLSNGLGPFVAGGRASQEKGGGTYSIADGVPHGVGGTPLSVAGGAPHSSVSGAPHSLASTAQVSRGSGGSSSAGSMQTLSPFTPSVAGGGLRGLAAPGSSGFSSSPSPGGVTVTGGLSGGGMVGTGFGLGARGGPSSGGQLGGAGGASAAGAAVGAPVRRLSAFSGGALSHGSASSAPSPGGAPGFAPLSSGTSGSGFGPPSSGASGSGFAPSSTGGTSAFGLSSSAGLGSGFGPPASGPTGFLPQQRHQQLLLQQQQPYAAGVEARGMPAAPQPIPSSGPGAGARLGYTGGLPGGVGGIASGGGSSMGWSAGGQGYAGHPGQGFMGGVLAGPGGAAGREAVAAGAVAPDAVSAAVAKEGGVRRPVPVGGAFMAASARERHGDPRGPDPRGDPRGHQSGFRSPLTGPGIAHGVPMSPIAPMRLSPHVKDST